MWLPLWDSGVSSCGRSPTEPRPQPRRARSETGPELLFGCGFSFSLLQAQTGTVGDRPGAAPKY